MFRSYVPEGEYFPSFKVDKILETKVMDSNVFTFLRPEVMLAMRLSNPIHAFAFDKSAQEEL